MPKIDVLENFRYLIDNFAGGENTKVDASKIRPDEMQKCLEFLMTEVGSLKKRTGCTGLNIDTTGSGINSLYPFFISDGTKKLIICSGEYIKKLNGLTLLELASGYSGDYFLGDAYNDRMYLCNDVNDNLCLESDDTIRIPGCIKPTIAPTVALNGAGGMTGNFYYSYSWVFPWGESSEGPVSVLISPSSQKVLVTITETTPSGATNIKIYRTIAGGSQRKYLINIALPTKIYDDNLGDGALGINAPTDNGAPPKSKLFKMYKSYGYWVPTANPYRLYWSILGWPEVVNADAFDDILKENGQEITAIEFTLNPDFLMIFKQGSIVRYTGTSPFVADTDPLIQDTLTETIGTESPRTIIRYGSDLLFFASDRKVYSLSRLILAERTSVEPIAISNRIEDILRNDINIDRLKYAHAFYQDNKYFLYIASKNSNYEDMCVIIDLLLQKRPITRAYPIEALSSCKWYGSSGEEITLLGASANQNLIQFLNGNTDLGNQIFASMKTRKIDLSMPFNRKIFDRAKVLIRTSKDYSLDIKTTITKEGFPKEKIKHYSGLETASISSTVWGEGVWNSGSLWGADVSFTTDVIDLPIDLYIGKDGETIEMEIYNIISGDEFILKSIEITGTLMRTRP